MIVFLKEESLQDEDGTRNEEEDKCYLEYPNVDGGDNVRCLR